MDCGFSEFLLKTTDRQIDLLALNRGLSGGIGLDDYTPGRPNFKGGGVWQDSPIAAGRRPVFGVRGNVADALTIKIAAKSHRAVIEAQIALDEMLEQAMAYWLQDTGIAPVWIVARAAGESERRYAVVYGYSFAEYDDPYHEPYLSGTGHVLDGLTLGLERSAWQHLPPFEMEEIPLYSLRAPINSGFSGKPETPILGGQYITSSYSVTDWLQVYRFDSSAGTYTEITTYPDTMFPNPMGNGDILYFRSGSTPIPGIFWPYEPGVAPADSIWEYWGGSSWEPLESVRSGVLPSIQANAPESVVVRWLMPPVQALVAPSAGDGLTLSWYIRLRVISAAAGSPPMGFSAAPYVPSQPYVQFDGDQIGGDLDALAAIEIYLDGIDDGVGEANLRIPADFGRIIVGARSTKRDGPDPDRNVFTAYIPCNTSWIGGSLGITVSYATSELTGAPSTGSVAYGTNAAATVWASNVADTTLLEAFRIIFDEDSTPWYKGEFRLFMRAKTTDTSTFTAGAQFRYRVQATSPNALTGLPPMSEVVGETVVVELINPHSESGWQLIDLGRIRMPPTGGLIDEDISYQINLIIDALIEPSKVIAVNDLILMPVDEWAADTSAASNVYNFSLYTGDRLKKWTIDSIQGVRSHIRANVEEYSTADGRFFTVGATPVIANREATLRTDTQQRLWFLFESLDAYYVTSSNRPWPNVINWANRVRLYKLQRYHFLRGDG